MKHLRHFLICILLCTAILSTLTPLAGAAFRDVPADSWAADAIQRAVDAGLIQGQTADSFGMGQPMTRGAFVTILCRFFGWESVTPALPTFDDTPADIWCYTAVETAAANGVIPLLSRGFRPREAITREEMAVMLVRALGYTTIAGLDLGLECPFTDVTTNRGYITMAYCLGISNGVTEAAFAPSRPASREQAVVMLMRVYDRYLQKPSSIIGIADSTEGLAELDGVDTVLIPAILLDCAGGIRPLLDGETAQAICSAARDAGMRAMLHITGSLYALTVEPAQAAQAAANAVTAGGYDGVCLEIRNSSKGYPALMAALRALLPDQPIYAAADAPAAGEAAVYDYAALSAQADRLILRTKAVSRLTGSFPTAPQDTLEDIYRALASLRGSVDMGKLSLWITSTGAVWTDGADAPAAAEKTIAALLKAEGTNTYYSQRYGSAYLTCGSGESETVIWYNDARSAADKAQLCALFGVSGFCISDLTGTAGGEDWSLLSGLRD